MKRAAIYIRVSTSDKVGDVFVQNLDAQREPLEQFCRSNGWELARVYSDRGSGLNPYRTHYRELMADARRKLFDVVVVWRFDRFARSTVELLKALDEFQALKIDFVSLKEAVNTTTPMGRALFAILGAIAEMERAIIQERCEAGREYARKHGTRTGNPFGRPRKVFRRDEARQLRAEGVPIREIARRLGVELEPCTGRVPNLLRQTRLREEDRNGLKAIIIASTYR